MPTEEDLQPEVDRSPIENEAQTNGKLPRVANKRPPLENEAPKNRKLPGVALKVSEKGGVSVYGLGRFPVTLYKEQWNRLLDAAEEIRVFIKENDAKLKTKA